MPDLWLSSQLHSITAHWMVSKIILLGDRSTRVQITCPGSLCSWAPTESWTHDLFDAQVIALLCHADQQRGNWQTQVSPGTTTTTTTTTTTVLRPFVQDYLGEPVPEETITHSPILIIIQCLSASSIYCDPQHPPCSIYVLDNLLHNLSASPPCSTSWSEALQLILHTFLYPISVFFSQRMPIPLQPVLL